jgi:tryptophan synthase beta subunit
MVVALYGHPHRVIVHDGNHLAQVLGKQPVKQHLVAIVHGGQIDVLTQRIGQPLVLYVGALDLHRQSADLSWQQAYEAQVHTLFSREGRALIQLR